jgi:hypothetical protein
MVCSTSHTKFIVLVFSREYSIGCIGPSIVYSIEHSIEPSMVYPIEFLLNLL